MYDRNDAEEQAPVQTALFPQEKSRGDAGPDNSVAELVEYRCLRAEILDRIKLRHSILLATTVILGIAMSKERGIALYPVLSMLISIAWLQNDSRIQLLAMYIRANYENSSTSFWWEHFIEENRSILWIGNVIVPHGAFFVLTQIYTINLIGAYYQSEDAAERRLFLLAVLACAATIALFLQKMHAQARFISLFRGGQVSNPWTRSAPEG